MEFSFNFVAKCNISTLILHELKKCFGAGLGSHKEIHNFFFFMQGIGQQENIDAKISSLSAEISAIKQDIAQINNEELLPLLKKNAQLLTAPVVKEYLDHQIARQDCYAAIQNKVCRHLIRQKTSFELIQLACEMEKKQHQEISCQLENLVESLKQSTDKLQQRLQVIAEQAEKAKPRSTISSEDGFSCR